MKLPIVQLSLLTIFISGLVPIPGLSHSLNRTKTTEYPDSSLLAQVASYRQLVDAANQEEQLAVQASANFITAFEQLNNTNNNARAIRLTNVLIETSTRAANHL